MVLDDIRVHPTYVINLDRRPDRWEEFAEQPMLKEFLKLQRFSAVDGSKLDVFDDKRISLHTRQNIIRNYRRSHYEINTLGAIGASLSHISIWKKLLDSDSEYVVVFEDDTLVLEKDMFLIDKLIPTLPAEWDMWLLGTHKWMFDGVPMTADKKDWWKAKAFTGAHAYVLSRRGAALLLEEPFPIETHIEFYICAVAQIKGLKMIRHPSLRMPFSMEFKKENDSDTFDSRLSCPVCYIPDNYARSMYMFKRNGYPAYAVSALAVAIVGYGLWKMLRNTK